MLIYNNKEIRNLVEQVQKNKEDIAAHYNIDRVLADFGIRVIGQLTSADQLEGIVGTEYGDAYAIGESAPYSFYVWTRADVNSGHPTDYWFNIGELAIIGPEGPQGPRGPQGPKGEATQIISVQGNPNEVYLGSARANDIAIDMTTGNIYIYTGVDTLWLYEGNIRGPQGIQGIRGPQGEQGPPGPQGPKGDTGDVGGFINIRAILNNTSQLPAPSTLNNLTIAYLIGETEPYDLYVQIGETSDTAEWKNTGPFNAATLVTVNGAGQNVWDADTKVERRNSANMALYGNFGNEDQMFTVGVGYNTVGNGRIVKYFGSGQAAPDTKPDDGTGFLYCAEPTKLYHATNKKYVDENTKLYEHVFSGQLNNSSSLVIDFVFSMTSKSAGYLVAPNGYGTGEEATKALFAFLNSRYGSGFVPNFNGLDTASGVDPVIFASFTTATSATFGLYINGHYFDKIFQITDDTDLSLCQISEKVIEIINDETIDENA